MKKQIIIWTALPNGLQGPLGPGAKLRVTAFVSPRLITSGTPVLGEFPSFLHWPHTVEAMRFAVQFQGGPTLHATRVSEDPDPDLWAALFTPTTTVESYVYPDQRNKSISSIPIAALQADIKSRHLDTIRALNQTPTQFPSTHVFNHIYGEVHITARAKETFAKTLKTVLAGHQAVPPPGRKELIRARGISPTLLNSLHSPPGLHYQVESFYNRSVSQAVSRSPQPLPTPEELKTKYDFHHMVSVLGNYPVLLAKLGLAIELEVDYEPSIPINPHSTTVRILPSQFANAPDVRPFTHYLLDKAGFRAAPNPGANFGQGSDLEAGMLLLSDPSRFEVVQIDVDGQALKLQSAVSTAAATTAAPGANTQTSLPAMRSGGISLIHTGRATALASTFTQAGQQNDAAGAANPVPLFADDLVRGYAMDILDTTTNSWRSLNLRDGTYTFERAPAAKHKLTFPDEGFVTMGTTQDPAGSADLLYIHEQIFRWNGWSLSAPRPMDPLDNATANPITPTTDPSTTQFGFAVSFAARPRSLPRLRFGHTYQVRARAVDLAGNRVAMDDPEALLPAVKSPATPFLRWEPITPPTVHLRKSIHGSPGESVQRLVIRSDFDQTVEHYFTAQSSPAYNEYAERHVLAPQTSQLMAEMHGMFDGPPPAGTSWYDLIVARDVSLPQDPNPPYDQQPIDVDKLPLPYLPDPLAAGATILGLPGGQIVQIPFSGAWPDFAPFRLLVKGIQDGQTPVAPEFNPDHRALTVELEQGDMVTVRYSCYFPPAALSLLGSWSWTHEAGVTKYHVPLLTHPPVAIQGRVEEPRPGVGEAAPLHPRTSIFNTPPANLWKTAPAKPWLVQLGPHKSWEALANVNWQTAALLGAAWLFTPFRELTLIHAVQHPLIKPSFSDRFHAQRDLGSTHAVLMDLPMPLSGKSTIDLDLIGRWYEPIDDPAQPAPTVRARHTHVSKIPIDAAITHLQYPHDPPYTSDSDKRFWHVFEDTKHRQVAYSAIATSRFREYFPFSDADLEADPTLITRSSDPGSLVQPNAEHPLAPDFTTVPPSGVIHVPNSARPSAPSLLYVIPTFAHRSAIEKDGSIAAERIGGGMRIYLERPWYSSGDDELLGVVLPNQTTAFKSKVRLTGLLSHALAFKRPLLDPSHYTQWGLDPLWRSRNAPTPYTPSLASFPDAVAEGNNLTIDEQPSVTVSVAGHLVNYDETRRLWYCDISLDPGQAYYPFVRLALARYQPYSVPNAHLSRLVLADFIQLTPNRLAVVTTNPELPNLLMITVSGPAPAQTNNIVTISLEQQSGAGPNSDPDLAWTGILGAYQELRPEATTNGALWRTREFRIPALPKPLPPLRLVIREYELYPGTNAAQGIAANIAFIPAPQQRRLVYAEVVDVLIPE